MKKLVLVLPGIKGGGAEKFVLNLYKAMETHQGYECHIVSLSRDVDHDMSPGVRIHYLDQVRKVSKKGLKRLTYRKKIVHIVDEYIDQAIGDDSVVLSNMMFVDKVMSLSRHRVFHVIHSAYSQSLLDGKPAFRRFFIKRNISSIYNHHPLIFVSRGAHDSFCAGFSTNVAKHVVYNPVPAEEIRALAEAETKELAGDFVVHVGRFNRAKRHDRLLKAFSRVRTDAKLVLLGDGKLENRIRSLVDELGLAGRVLFMGFRKNPYPFLKQAQALVLSSDFEGLPTVVLEAISLGTPVVATDCPGGIREIIDMPSPSLVPLGDMETFTAAIADALNHPERYRSPLADKFSSQVVAEQYDALFRGTSRQLKSA